ncbi:MAG: ABC transporter permease [Xanthomonas sp.]|jgi:ABC-2 type transport system permease protein|uniref:ABC transporter permease n=1 Tax=Pseudoxanthomonas mexicana TaxID=128785 RepID=UPI0007824E28|nr:ABC transporter permease [Pseudoxanthomonas mexicana]MBA3930456.1 ABC transporter permease [Xanthomonas sp.]
METTATVPFSSTRAYVLEARYEFLRLLRTPSFSLPCLLFPPVFYLLFGVLLGGKGGPAVASYMLAGYGVFGVVGVALFGFGVTVAMDREQGLLTLKRAQPMPPGAYLVAKMAMAMLFAAIILLLLGALAAGVAGVRLAPMQWLLLSTTCLLGVLPFSALGLWLGTLVSGSGAPALINLVYLPMAFLSGLWVPLAMLPPVLQSMAPVWPAYHLAQLAQKIVGVDAGGSAWLHLGVLAAITGVFFTLARRRLVQ